MHELLKLTATQVVELLRKGELKPTELVEVSAARIQEVEPHINAMPTLCLDQAIEQAKRFSEQNYTEMSGTRGWLGGLPVSVKDLIETAGVRTTFGSKVYENYVPDTSNVLYTRLKHLGAIMMGKSNTPEFGAGASTFNEVFGMTRNPWNTEKSVAGSSGGACASVATGEVWLATGSDLGGSLRTPASFNSVVGLRPSIGRVAHTPQQPFNTLMVEGPIARNCADCALFLDTMAGFHPDDPLSYPAPKTPYTEFIRNPVIPKRVAYSHDLGITRVDSEVQEICMDAASEFAQLRATVTPAHPDFSGVIDAFSVLRGLAFATQLGPDLHKYYNVLKPEVIWNVEQGLALTADDISRAECVRKNIYHSVVEFFGEFDLLVCPTAIVPPFDVELRFVESIDGYTFDTYFEWIAITFAITMTGCPAISIPAGFTSDGLPVGLQIIGPPRGEGPLLSAGYLLGQILNLDEKLPIDPIVQ